MRADRAYLVWLLMNGGASLSFALVFTVNAVYYVQRVGLNPLQLLLVGTALEATVFVGEVPTGVLADTYSRRLSVIAGYVLVGAAFLVEGSVPTFGAVLLSQVLWGLGVTFTSGAAEAWIAGEIGAGRAGQAYLRGTQAGLLGTLAGAGLSVALASARLNLPIVVGGLLFVGLAGVLAVTMREHGFRPAPAEDRPSWRVLGATLTGSVGAVRRHPVLLTILVIGAFYGAASEGFDRLWQAHLLVDIALPRLGAFKLIVWFGLIGAGATLLGLGATEVVRRRVDTASHVAVARALLAINALLVVSVVAFGLAGNFALALGAYWAASVLRTVADPLTAAWVAQNTGARLRATVFSLSSQANALGQIAGGPVVGAVGTLASVRAALAVSGLLLAPALALYARTLRRDGAPALVPDVEAEETAYAAAAPTPGAET